MVFQIVYTSKMVQKRSECFLIQNFFRRFNTFSKTLISTFCCSIFKNLLKAPFGDHANAISFLTIGIEGLLIWALLFAIFDHDAEPGGQLFYLILLSVLSYISGWLITFLKMPPLLGMILCGVVLRNVGWFDASGVYLKVVSFVR